MHPSPPNERAAQDPDVRSRGPAVGRLFKPSKWTPRSRRRVRRVALWALAVWVGVTVASVSYNVATDHVPTPPAGLTFVRAGDINTRYRAWGTTGSPIVLVPGAFETADTFAALEANWGATTACFLWI